MTGPFERSGAALNHPLATGVLGLCVGFSFCYVSMVRPLFVRLDQREESLQEWERINRMERETLATMKSVGAEEMRKWVATLDEQNSRFAVLQAQLHRQELQLTGPATSYLVFALLAVIVVIGFTAWMIRDGNADAARTLHSAVAVLPALRKAVKRRTVVRVSASDEAPRRAVPESGPLAIEEERDQAGAIATYFVDRSYGFITPDAGGRDVFFHLSEVQHLSGSLLRPGTRVTFRRGKGRRGRGCATNVRLLD
jgi:CspA family cold shock protein